MIALITLLFEYLKRIRNSAFVHHPQKRQAYMLLLYKRIYLNENEGCGT